MILVVPPIGNREHADREPTYEDRMRMQVHALFSCLSSASARLVGVIAARRMCGGRPMFFQGMALLHKTRDSSIGSVSSSPRLSKIGTCHIFSLYGRSPFL
jgi:hypothetical protein